MSVFFLPGVRATSNNYCFQLNNSRHSVHREKEMTWVIHRLQFFLVTQIQCSLDGPGHYGVLIALPSQMAVITSLISLIKWKRKIYTSEALRPSPQPRGNVDPEWMFKHLWNKVSFKKKKPKNKTKKYIWSHTLAWHKPHFRKCIGKGFSCISKRYDLIVKCIFL